VAFTNTTTGDAIADNDCRDKAADGPWTNATGTLYNEDLTKQGRWLENFGYGDVNYTVISIGPDYAVEYDCTTDDKTGLTNYCIHVMSKTRTMDQALFDSLMQNAIDMGLNANNLPIQMTKQAGC
jgi:lipocalin